MRPRSGEHPSQERTCLVVPVLELAAAVLAAEVPHHAVQLLGRPLLAQLRAVVAGDAPQPQTPGEVLFVQEFAAWKRRGFKSETNNMSKNSLLLPEELTAGRALALERARDRTHHALRAPDQTCPSKPTRKTKRDVRRCIRYHVGSDASCPQTSTPSSVSELPCFTSTEPCSSITNTPSRRFATGAVLRGTTFSHTGTPLGSRFVPVSPHGPAQKGSRFHTLCREHTLLSSSFSELLPSPTVHTHD